MPTAAKILASAYGESGTPPPVAVGLLPVFVLTEVTGWVFPDVDWVFVPVRVVVAEAVLLPEELTGEVVVEALVALVEVTELAQLALLGRSVTPAPLQSCTVNPRAAGRVSRFVSE